MGTNTSIFVVLDGSWCGKLDVTTFGVQLYFCFRDQKGVVAMGDTSRKVVLKVVELLEKRSKGISIFLLLLLLGGYSTHAPPSLSVFQHRFLYWQDLKVKNSTNREWARSVTTKRKCQRCVWFTDRSMRWVKSCLPHNEQENEKDAFWSVVDRFRYFCSQFLDCI